MFVKDERTMEDFISNDKSFNSHIEEMYELKNVELLGRQVHIGDKNIIDLLYQGDGNTPYNNETKFLIIVELKFRPLEIKDLSQVGRYVVATNAYLFHSIGQANHKDYKVCSVLVGTGITVDLAHFMNGGLYDESIVRLMFIKTNVDYDNVTDTMWNVEDMTGRIEESVQQFKNTLVTEGQSKNEQRD